MIVARLGPFMKAMHASRAKSRAWSANTSVELGAQSVTLIQCGLTSTEILALKPVASASMDLQPKQPPSAKLATTHARHAMEQLTPAKAATSETLRSIITRWLINA